MATTTSVPDLDEATGELPPGRGRILVEYLHGWITTVDHKRLGILYIGSALIFMVVAGLEAAVMRWQLAAPNNDVVSPETYNRLFTLHGTTMVFFVGMPILFGFGNYLVPLMIGARDMAFSAAQCILVLDLVLRRPAAVLQRCGRRWLIRSGNGAGCGLVCLCTADGAGLLARPQHRLLDPQHSAQRDRLGRDLDQHHHHDDLHALPRHEADAHAAAGLALHRHVLSGDRGDRPR